MKRHLWESHKNLIDQYAGRFTYNLTPGRKRKKQTVFRWAALTESVENFNRRDSQCQIDTLISHLLKLADCCEDPPENVYEEDPEADLDFDIESDLDNDAD